MKTLHEFSTADLVNELKNREAIQTSIVDVEASYTISNQRRGEGEEITGSGPAIILIVID